MCFITKGKPVDLVLEMVSYMHLIQQNAEALLVAQHESYLKELDELIHVMNSLEGGEGKHPLKYTQKCIFEMESNNIFQNVCLPMVAGFKETVQKMYRNLDLNWLVTAVVQPQPYGCRVVITLKQDADLTSQHLLWINSHGDIKYLNEVLLMWKQIFFMYIDFTHCQFICPCESIFCWIVTQSGNRRMRNENKWWIWLHISTLIDAKVICVSTGNGLSALTDYHATCAVTLHGQNSHCSGCPCTAQWLGCAARLLRQEDAPSFDLSNNYESMSRRCNGKYKNLWRSMEVLLVNHWWMHGQLCVTFVTICISCQSVLKWTMLLIGACFETNHFVTGVRSPNQVILAVFSAWKHKSADISKTEPHRAKRSFEPKHFGMISAVQAMVVSKIEAASLGAQQHSMLLRDHSWCHSHLWTLTLLAMRRLHLQACSAPAPFLVWNEENNIRYRQT